MPILKENLFKTKPSEGFKQMDDKGWEMFEKSGALDVVKNSIKELFDKHYNNTELSNITEAFNKCKEELEYAKKLNNEYAEVLKTCTSIHVLPSDAQSKAMRLLNTHVYPQF